MAHVPAGLGVHDVMMPMQELCNAQLLLLSCFRMRPLYTSAIGLCWGGVGHSSLHLSTCCLAVVLLLRYARQHIHILLIAALAQSCEERMSSGSAKCRIPYPSYVYVSACLLQGGLATAQVVRVLWVMSLSCPSAVIGAESSAQILVAYDCVLCSYFTPAFVICVAVRAVGCHS
jgi:hypothetical protein